jgi:hypothetical protein
MVLNNICRCCGHRVCSTLRKCMECGSFSDTKRSKKILSSIFVVAAILLILLVSRVLL